MSEKLTVHFMNIARPHSVQICIKFSCFLAHFIPGELSRFFEQLLVECQCSFDLLGSCLSMSKTNLRSISAWRTIKFIDSILIPHEGFLDR